MKEQRMSATTGSLRVVLSASVVRQTTGDGLVLVDTKTGERFGVNDVGARIWSLLQESRDVDGLIQSLEAEYAAPAGRLRADVLAFLSELQAQHLLTLVGNE